MPQKAVESKVVDPNECPDDWVVMKGGYFYRPGAKGYTPILKEAGRWPHAEAVKLVNSDPACTVSIEHASTFPDTSECLILKVSAQGHIDQYGPGNSDFVIDTLPAIMVDYPDFNFVVVERGGDGRFDREELAMNGCEGAQYLRDACAHRKPKLAEIEEMLALRDKRKSTHKVSSSAIAALTKLVIDTATERLVRDNLVPWGSASMGVHWSKYFNEVMVEMGLAHTDVHYAQIAEMGMTPDVQKEPDQLLGMTM